MEPLTFYIVDVFARERYQGNQLAVFLDTANIDSGEMQKIAREINYSETTFILSREPQEGGYDVRIFTPERELPFAGHPTLGTAYILREKIVTNPHSTILLSLKVGQIPVTKTVNSSGVELLWMQQKSPTFQPFSEGKRLAQVLNLDPDVIDPHFPIQEVSTGISCLIVPLKTQADLKKIQVNRERYFDLVRQLDSQLILAFCPETYNKENDLSVRVFAESLGIPEDPATGSANGCLAAYLVENAYFGTKAINIRVEQGYEIQRPSLLFLKAEQKAGDIEVFVGGSVVAIARGEWFLED